MLLQMAGVLSSLIAVKYFIVHTDVPQFMMGNVPIDPS